MILNMEKMTFEDIIGEGIEFKKAILMAKRAAALDLPVLLLGETGTGKELFARAIHSQGKRASKVYLAENCGAIPKNLVEGIFFGTEKGAFTQATTRMGLFELADGGTLLLDELNSMPLDLQAKLLRTLQEGTIRRVGGVKEIPINVRVIAAMNENPEQMILNGTLRRDLFYRLNVIRIEIPPLRKHKEDIPLYIEHFLRKYNHKYEKKYNTITADALNELQNREYPGNVRELENIIESAVAMSDDTQILDLKDFII